MSASEIAFLYVASYAVGICAIGTFLEIGRPVPRLIAFVFAAFFAPLVIASLLVIKAVEARK